MTTVPNRLKPALIAAAQSNWRVPASQFEQPPLSLGAGEALLSRMIHQAELINIKKERAPAVLNHVSWSEGDQTTVSLSGCTLFLIALFVCGLGPVPCAAVIKVVMSGKPSLGLGTKSSLAGDPSDAAALLAC